MSARAGLRILVVDDNHDAAETLAALLQWHKHDVAVAHDGIAAMAVLEAFIADVAILDIAMPRLDGITLAGRLRADARYKQVVLIAYTAFSHETMERQIAEAGFDHHLVKPRDLELLKQLLAEHVSRLAAPQSKIGDSTY